MAPFPKSIVISTVMNNTATNINPRYLTNQAIQDRDGLNPIIFINSCETKECVRLDRITVVIRNLMNHRGLSSTNIITVYYDFRIMCIIVSGYLFSKILDIC